MLPQPGNETVPSAPVYRIMVPSSMRTSAPDTGPVLLLTVTVLPLQVEEMLAESEGRLVGADELPLPPELPEEGGVEMMKP